MPLPDWRKLVGADRAVATERRGPAPAVMNRVEAAFWVVLARGPNLTELHDRRRAIDTDEAFEQLLLALIGSSEFRLVHEGYAGGTRTGAPPAEVRSALEALGPAPTFIDLVYQYLLGRPVDDSGRAHYAAQLEGGGTRADIVKVLALSDEFEARYRRVCPHVGTLPRDVQLCELANPAKWDNPEWMSLLASLGRVPSDRLSMHRKGYEWTQTLFGLQRLRRLTPEARVVSVGAGHEPILYWLANQVGSVVATDMYETDWSGALAGEGDEDVLQRPEDYAPFPYRRDRLSFLKMDGRALAFASGSFDIAYSLSSIEHFGGLEGAMAAVDEMARVLAPGGMLVLATEYILDGPKHHEAFTPAEIHALVDRPGLRLVQPIDERVHARYEIDAVDIERNPFQTPHMAVRIGDTVFTSVIAFLERH